MVDGKSFKWMISRDPDVVVQSESGSLLLVHGVRTIRYDCDYDRYTDDPITPRSIASIIRHSIKSGWKFDEKGPVFKISVGDLLRHKCPTCKELVIRNDHPPYECGANVIRELMES